MPPATEILLKPGDVLYREGGPNDFGYIIETGEVILYSDHKGGRVDCERRGAGSILGELSILTGQPRTVTVEAVEACRIFKISADQILSQFNDLDPILKACVETSISFSAQFWARDLDHDTPVPLVPGKLRNAERLIEQFRFQQDILGGLERGEFHMVYQPIVTLSDGRPTGLEALMRWDHPVKGAISPDQFITAAEDAGLIGQLTQFALIEATQALQRLRAQPGAHPDLYMSINISGRDNGGRSFVDFLTHVLDANDLEPCHVRLEVTETALVADTVHLDQNLARLRALGCGISIDDFGTGYSNLAYLKTLPLPAIKIDRIFAGDAHAHPVSCSLARLLVQAGPWVPFLPARSRRRYRRHRHRTPSGGGLRRPRF